MQLEKGAQLGPYEIVGPLGAGGMGEVYRARDTRLGRFVAIKVLPADTLEDPKLRLRLEREAKAIAALNHPNICALYDVGAVSEHERSIQYLVMECLEGETLDERLKRGPLPLDQVVRYATEVAEALDKAHRHQILHRDLKPSNIMITKTGVRLFDFGLAKQVRDPVAFAEGESTAEKPITANGSIVGTLEYMAPEQLQGREPDMRTDIFSFGVCLFEMITGQRLFRQNSRAGVIAAILEQDPPPISTVRPEIPRSLEWLVRNCLAKDPDERLQTAHDVLLELRRIADETRSVETLDAPSSKKWIVATVALVAALVAAAAIIALRRPQKTSSSTASIKRLSIALPASAPLSPGDFEKLAVSADGSRIAYVGGDHRQIHVYSMATQEAKPLAGTEGSYGPFFSPDGEWIGFSTTNRELKKISVTSGSSIVLSAGRSIRGATWGPDNTIVFADVYRPLQKISASGGPVEPLMPNETNTNVRWPSFMPGGESVLSTVSDFSGDYENARVVIRSTKTGESTNVVNGGTYGRYHPAGYVVYFHSRTLFAVPFDRRTSRSTGSPFPIVSDVDDHPGSGLAHFAIASDGSLFYLPLDPAESQLELMWVDRSGHASPITGERRSYGDPKVSPDGKRLLVLIGPRPRTDLWTYDIARDAWSRVTREASNDSGIWSPDGHQIAFASNKNGHFDLYVASADGSGMPTQITSRRAWDFPSSWSPDGKTIAVMEQYPATAPDIFVVAPRGGAIPERLVATSFDEHGAVFSPDGHWIAYESNDSGRFEIYVQNYPLGERRWLVSTSGGRNPVWKRDGGELFYRNGDKMMSVTTKPGSDFSAGSRKPSSRAITTCLSTSPLTAGSSWSRCPKNHPAQRSKSSSDSSTSNNDVHPRRIGKTFA